MPLWFNLRPIKSPAAPIACRLSRCRRHQVGAAAERSRHHEIRLAATSNELGINPLIECRQCPLVFDGECQQVQVGQLLRPGQDRESNRIAQRRISRPELMPGKRAHLIKQRSQQCRIAHLPGISRRPHDANEGILGQATPGMTRIASIPPEVRSIPLRRRIERKAEVHKAPGCPHQTLRRAVPNRTSLPACSSHPCRKWAPQRPRARTVNC